MLRMRVRSYIICIMLWGCLMGLGALWAVDRVNAETDDAGRAAGDAVLLDRDFDRFLDSFSQWLMVSDLILGSDLNYLFRGASQLEAATRKQLRTIEQSSFGASRGGYLRRIRSFVDAHAARLEAAQHLQGDDRTAKLAEMLSSYDDESEVVLETIAILATRLDQHVRELGAAQGDALQFRQTAEWILAGAFLLAMVAAGHWTSGRISHPLVRLTREARRAQDGSDNTQLTQHGPREVRDLAQSFTTLVVSLEERVRERTVVLRETNERLEAASKSKSDFLANMSHEIRTPMTAILGYSENLKEAELSIEDRRHAIDTIWRNGNHLLDLINNILDISKIEAGRFTLECVKFNPAQLMSDVMTLMKVRAEARHLALTFEMHGPVPECLESDPMRLRQILINVMGNAIKFTKVGSVRLIVRFVHADAEGRPALQMTVIDTGIGMTEAQVTRVFEPFTQADESMSRRFGGTGLGLSISGRLADLLGGSISIESQEGVGTTMMTSIPVGLVEGAAMITAISEASKAHVSHSESKAPNIACRLLYAEDGRDNQALISFLLKKAGATVTLAENGRVAVDMVMAATAKGQPYDIILMDMQMPELDGYEATRELREHGWRGPIIALTANAMAEDRAKCLAAGCDDFATKPVNRRQLIDLINQYLQRQVLSM